MEVDGKKKEKLSVLLVYPTRRSSKQAVDANFLSIAALLKNRGVNYRRLGRKRGQAGWAPHRKTLARLKSP